MERLVRQLKDSDLIGDLDGMERRLLCAQAAEAIIALNNSELSGPRAKASERQLERLMDENERLVELLADAKKAIGDLMHVQPPAFDRESYVAALNRAAEVLEAE